VPAIQYLTAQLLVRLRVDVPAELARVLDALESDAELAPTHWGEARGVRDPYDRGALLEAVAAAGPGGIVPEVRRTRPLRYTAHWYAAGDGSLSAVHLDADLVPDAATARAFCDTATRLAAALPLDFGHVDVRFVDQPPGTTLMRGASAHHIDAYCRQGPDTLFARSFFGPRLVALVGGGDHAEGVRRLAAAGGAAAPLGATGVRLDLSADPWSLDPVALKEAQAAVDARLRPTGVLAVPVSRWDYAPGPAWQRPALA
jgi:hypothetical protein